MTEAKIPYFSPRLEVRPVDEKGGGGVFARQPIPAGEHLITWGGEIIDWTTLQRLPPDVQSRKTVQIEENQYLLTVGEPDPGDYVNHSCDPNAGLRDNVTLVAMRDIAPGEEICIDYAMCDGTP
ncbi:MAG: SET domain-containing protein, partial [Anaerolineae bacterium]|nr:SET domain-containing protein [Anaerolineae bacterium]